jgi:Tfp pilus assembly ATPase PilU
LQLRDAIRCVICQRLIRKVGGGRIPAFELLFNDIKHIGDCILSGDTLGIRVGMQQSLSQSMLFEQSLIELWKAKLISQEDALASATSPDTFDQMRYGTYRPPPLEPSR